MPAIDDLVIDEAGNLWAREPGSLDTGARVWAVHGPDGAYLGPVRIPAMEVTHIGRRTVAGILMDGLGVQRAAVYPLVKGSPDPGGGT